MPDPGYRTMQLVSGTNDEKAQAVWNIWNRGDGPQWDILDMLDLVSQGIPSGISSRRAKEKRAQARRRAITRDRSEDKGRKR